VRTDRIRRRFRKGRIDPGGQAVCRGCEVFRRVPGVWRCEHDERFGILRAAVRGERRRMKREAV